MYGGHCSMDRRNGYITGEIIPEYAIIGASNINEYSIQSRYVQSMGL